ncbi:uncharacterized protein ColSpa_10237 [Colletotrichum spaethianum]|uniref:Uncharacterized protein n=1 Tax=Colletotrichum spaethianum TaxID=700344 RepID=A0AA37UKH3_9PEZI|nr:uncharacterized protein ColSpa_10237 [Colletotrichum spaethianum]GKT50056.1 hypothetical protein ColSpa_10237 [Colletotrichum spaethianum]
MSHLPASPRKGSPVLLPRRLSEELGDFSFSSDEYDDEEQGDEEDEIYNGIETPASSRKSSHSPASAAPGHHFRIGTHRKEKRQPPFDGGLYAPFPPLIHLPVLPDDFISSAADEVVKIMPEQADFMKRMVEGWREIQRRSSYRRV